MLSSKYRDYFDKLMRPVAKFFILLKIGPNFITILAFITSLITAFAFIREELFYALYLLLLTSFLDVLDGAIAKISNNTTKFGGFLDSVFDRFSDSAILIGIAFYLDDHSQLIMIVLVGTLLVSYSRARAETLISKCDVGIAERAERLIVLIIVTFLEAIDVAPFIDKFYIALIILAILTYFTVIQRILYTYLVLKERE